MVDEPFIVKRKILLRGAVLHIIDVEGLNESLKKLIEKHITSIHSKGVLSDLAMVKSDLVQRLKDPRDVPDKKIYMGLVAEFFAHLYLNYQGFNQESLYINMEDGGGMKKGFDGYYSIGGEDWLMESKSTIKESSKYHAEKVDEAYKDLNSKVSGKSITKKGRVKNPWLNALMHAHVAKSESDVVDRISKANAEFSRGVYHSIAELNIVPTSTIFLNVDWEATDETEIEKVLNNWIEDKDFKKIQILSFTQGSLDIFWEYLTS